MREQLRAEQLSSHADIERPIALSTRKCNYPETVYRSVHNRAHSVGSGASIRERYRHSAHVRSTRQILCAEVLGAEDEGFRAVDDGER
jgi:hypothetical protein